MSSSKATLPKVRSDLTVRKISDDEFVVKTRARREYFCIGREEHFLLMQMEINGTVDGLVDAFEKEFGDTLTNDDIDAFLKLLRSRGLTTDVTDEQLQLERAKNNNPEEDEEETGHKQNLLFYRVPLYDPDRLFSRLEPALCWIWTRGFLVAAALMLATAALVLWTNRGDVASGFSQAMRWETVVVVGFAILMSTALHEFAHGITCKHFGGEVREVGVLLMFFMPCMYCNVSDAWLIPERSKRLCITAAGAICDLCLWSLCVFVWRITILDSLINHLAFVMMTICGSRSLININPLLRFDGYYLVSDALSIPNLRPRAMAYWMSHLRWLLWGAEKPAKEPRGRALLIYGIFCWLFAIVLLDLIFFRVVKYVADEFGLIGIAFSLLLLAYAIRRVFKGFFASEFVKMVKTRKKRTSKWLMGIAGVLVLLFVVPVPYYASGEFEVRPGVMVETRAPVAGFIRQIAVEEGARVETGDLLVRLESPDLDNRIATKQAELRESEAKLAKLRVGPRPEEVNEQRHRVSRLASWVKLGEEDLEQSRRSYENELEVLDSQIRESETELEFAKNAFVQSQLLYNQGALAGVQLKSERKGLTVLEAKRDAIRAERRARVAKGVRTAEGELAKRRQELADAIAKLSLLEAGTRHEDLTAEEAHQERVKKELEFLTAQRERLEIVAPVSGVVATPRMREKMGQLAPLGGPICVIEDIASSSVEISVDEATIGGIKPGQHISLKARALPFKTFDARVERIAPAVTQKEQAQPTQNVQIVVHCSVDNSSELLKFGMTGFARIDRGTKSLGIVVIRKMMRYLRTEFWW